MVDLSRGIQAREQIIECGLKPARNVLIWAGRFAEPNSVSKMRNDEVIAIYLASFSGVCGKFNGDVSCYPEVLLSCYHDEVVIRGCHQG